MNATRPSSRQLVGLLLLVAGILVYTSAFGVETESYEPPSTSAFELIFKQSYPNIRCQDAPSILNGLGITIRYSVMELSTRYEKTWRFSGKGFERRTPTDLFKASPTIADGRQLLALSGLDMMDIMQHEELTAAGERDRLVALLTTFINPKLDKYNRMALEGYDPRMCINASRDHVYQLDIDSGKLNDIRKSAKLFRAGRYEEYRAKLQEYLQDYPSLSYLHVGIGNSYFAEGDLMRAQQWYRQGALANPMNPMLGYSMAFCHLVNGDVPLAIEALTGSVMICRNNLFSWLALDCLLSGEGGRVIDQRFRNRTRAAGAMIWVDKGVQPRLLESWLYYGAAEIAINHQRPNS